MTKGGGGRDDNPRRRIPFCGKGKVEMTWLAI